MRRSITILDLERVRRSKEMLRALLPQHLGKRFVAAHSTQECTRGPQLHLEPKFEDIYRRHPLLLEQTCWRKLLLAMILKSWRPEPPLLELDSARGRSPNPHRFLDHPGLLELRDLILPLHHRKACSEWRAKTCPSRCNRVDRHFQNADTLLVRKDHLRGVSVHLAMRMQSMRPFPYYFSLRVIRGEGA